MRFLPRLPPFFLDLRCLALPLAFFSALGFLAAFVGLVVLAAWFGLERGGGGGGATGSAGSLLASSSSTESSQIETRSLAGASSAVGAATAGSSRTGLKRLSSEVAVSHALRSGFLRATASLTLRIPELSAVAAGSSSPRSAASSAAWKSL